jgi:hypothetical protein
MEVYGAPASLFGQVVFQPVLHGQIRRVRGGRAGHHDRRVHVAEHVLVVRARLARAFDQDRHVERLRPRLTQHLDDAQVDTARLHDLVPDMRHQVVEESRMGERQDPLAGLQAELSDQPPRHRRIIEREPWRLCEHSSPEGHRRGYPQCTSHEDTIRPARRTRRETPVQSSER